MKRFCISCLCVFIILGIASGVTSAQEEWMPDPNLRQAVREALALPDERPLTQAEMPLLTGFDAESREIKALKGLEHATNLTWLGLGVNEIRDLSPLAGLNRLEGLWIFANPLSNITPLANLVNLKTLDLGGCQISGLRSLTNLRNLESLRLHWNQIEDITPLTNLTKLRELWLNHNQIVDVSPLASLKNLTDLQIEGNAIRDFRPLLGLTLKNVDIDIRTLHELTSIEVEILDPNLEHAVRVTLELPDEIPLTQLIMNQLIGLEADDSQITDLAGLEHAINLTWLTLGGNEIRDLRPLAGLTQLEALYIWDNPISDLSPLANLTTLKTLHMQACHISDISPLSTLTGLVNLHLYHNRITDITPLASLVQLTELHLSNNHIVDISPLENLTMLEKLWIQNNRITDYSPLSALLLIHFEHDEICELTRSPILERIQNRNFPSFFQAWSDISNQPALSRDALVAYHDLYWNLPQFDLNWQATTQGVQLVGSLKEAQTKRDALLNQNPNLIFLVEIRMRDAFPNKYYNEDYPYWLRNEAGDRLKGWPGTFLLDFTHPGQQDIIVQQALAVAQCGLYDGVFLDWWSEDHPVLSDDWSKGGYLGNEAEQRARDIIIQRIRAGVGDDFLIIVNTNRRKIPRTGTYINGTFMETLRDHDGGYTHDGLAEIESTLLWAEEHLREPRVNCLEGWGVPTESPDSPRNLRWMRVFTTMSLTHSDGYVLYNDGIQHDHYWYDFWDADLGQPIGEKAQLHENRDGLFIREFTNGWAVYNRSGKPQAIRLPEQATGVESGIKNTLHIVPDLDGEIYLKSGLQTPPTVDVNGDGTVNVLDLVAVANGFGKDAPDVNADGVVNVLDLVAVANAF